MNEVIGHSVEGRPLECVRRGAADAPYRVLIMAGQHGDEPGAREAVRRLMNAPDLETLAPQMRLAFLPDVNPDGTARQTRHNAADLDLNRDHQRLLSPELTAVHAFARAFRPHAILDVHNYLSRREHLLEKDLVLDHDIFLDGPSHPAIRHPVTGARLEAMLATISTRLAPRAVSCARYVIFTPDQQVRHSTLDVCDARNALALRTGALTVLVEGREPRRKESAANRERLCEAEHLALREILRWLAENRPLLAPPAADDPLVPVRFRYLESPTGFSMRFRHRRTREPVTANFADYDNDLRITKRIAPPLAYALPPGHAAIATLHRHGFASAAAEPDRRYEIERYQVLAAPDENRRPKLRIEREQRNLAGWEIFTADANAAPALTIHLEPASKYGLHRFAELDLPIRAAEPYPVLRIVG